MTNTKQFSRHSRIAAPPGPKHCHHCPNEAKSRGLCSSCLSAANRKVANGETTWEFLESAGLCDCKAKIPFLIALDAALAAVKAAKKVADKRGTSARKGGR